METEEAIQNGKEPIELNPDSASSWAPGILPVAKNLYDFQKIRIASGNRVSAMKRMDPEKYGTTIQIMEMMSDELKKLEDHVTNKLKTIIESHPLWSDFLGDVKGIGPRLGSTIITSADPHKTETVSGLWKLWGLAVVDGQADKLKKGEKASYSPELKKTAFLIARQLLMAKSDYADFYANYKNRKEQTKVDTCMLCKGSKKHDKKKCPRCAGTGGPAPWGRSAKHVDMAARRYMVKAFLRDYYVALRTAYGLSVRVPYEQEYLQKSHSK